MAQWHSNWINNTFHVAQWETTDENEPTIMFNCWDVVELPIDLPDGRPVGVTGGGGLVIHHPLTFDVIGRIGRKQQVTLTTMQGGTRCRREHDGTAARGATVHKAADRVYVSFEQEGEFPEHNITEADLEADCGLRRRLGATVRAFSLSEVAASLRTGETVTNHLAEVSLDGGAATLVACQSAILVVGTVPADSQLLQKHAREMERRATTPNTFFSCSMSDERYALTLLDPLSLRVLHRWKPFIDDTPENLITPIDAQQPQRALNNFPEQIDHDGDFLALAYRDHIGLTCYDVSCIPPKCLWRNNTVECIPFGGLAVTKDFVVRTCGIFTKAAEVFLRSTGEHAYLLSSDLSPGPCLMPFPGAAEFRARSEGPIEQSSESACVASRQDNLILRSDHPGRLALVQLSFDSAENLFSPVPFPIPTSVYWPTSAKYRRLACDWERGCVVGSVERAGAFRVDFATPLARPYAPLDEGDPTLGSSYVFACHGVRSNLFFPGICYFVIVPRAMADKHEWTYDEYGSANQALERQEAERHGLSDVQAREMWRRKGDGAWWYTGTEAERETLPHTYKEDPETILDRENNAACARILARLGRMRLEAMGFEERPELIGNAAKRYTDAGAPLDSAEVRSEDEDCYSDD